MSHRWRGFSAPTYTQIPDEFFDELMVDLSESELRVCLYLMRRTFGFKKTADAVSLKQLIHGIRTRDGKVLDRGCGLSHTSVKRGLKGLLEKGVISVAKIQSPDGDYETNVYTLVFAKPVPPMEEGTEVARGRHEKFLPPEVDRPSVTGRHEGCLPVGNSLAHGVGTRVASQETVIQQTEEQETDFELRNSKSTQSGNSSRARDAPEPPKRDGHRMSLEERAAWEERMDAQAAYLRSLQPKPAR